MFVLTYMVYKRIMNIVSRLSSFIIFTILCSYVLTLNEAEMRAGFTKIVFKCLKDKPVDPKELVNMQLLLPPKTKEGKCLLACAYKTEGTLNAQGMYDIEHAYKMAELAKEGDEQRLINGRKVADICSKVNEASVSDGNDGCDRAVLVFKCVTENAPKFGFKIQR